MKILIAEDDENSRHLLEDVLSSEGYEVESFDNGLKALSFLQTEPVDLVISDILMPELDGYGLCRALKQNFNLQKIPNRILITFHAQACNHAFANPHKVRVMAKCFTGMNIRDMYLNGWRFYGRKSISNGN